MKSLNTFLSLTNLRSPMAKAIRGFATVALLAAPVAVVAVFPAVPASAAAKEQVIYSFACFRAAPTAHIPTMEI